MLSIRIDTGEIGKLARRLEAVSKKQVKIAIAAGLSRAVKAGEKVAKEGIVGAYNIKPGVVAKRFSKHVDAAKQTGTIKARSGRTSRIPAIVFAVGKLAKKSPSIQIRKDRASKVLKHAFVATMPSGHKGIYQRVRGTRKLKEVMAIDVPQMVGGSGVVPLVQDRMAEIATKRITHELQFRLNKALKS